MDFVSNLGKYLSRTFIKIDKDFAYLEDTDIPGSVRVCQLVLDLFSPSNNGAGYQFKHLGNKGYEWKNGELRHI
jgi:hypothetical protein